MAKTLVIVESPAKARTLSRFLGDRYQVEASYGHVRDLPESASQVPDEIRKKKWGRLGVDIEGDFKPYYVVPDDKRKHLQGLKTALKGASEVMLATDPDREGESISWHLLQVLKPKVPVKRIVFHEITKKAIDQAVKDAHDVDDNLVRAQESRRILDRLYGYTLSPVLWKKVQTGLSAGRVQSVAVRIIVDREEERLAFRSARYSDLDAQFSAEGRTFAGTLTRLDTAFSRDRAEKVYVQHRMLEHAAELWNWLDAGGAFYVCGDAQRMASDVDKALRQVIAAEGKMTAAEADKYVSDMVRAGRYQRDVY